jgi:hypothetical protein
MEIGRNKKVREKMVSGKGDASKRRDKKSLNKIFWMVHWWVLSHSSHHGSKVLLHLMN